MKTPSTDEILLKHQTSTEKPLKRLSNLLKSLPKEVPTFIILYGLCIGLLTYSGKIEKQNPPKEKTKEEPVQSEGIEKPKGNFVLITPEEIEVVARLTNMEKIEAIESMLNRIENQIEEIAGKKNNDHQIQPNL